MSILEDMGVSEHEKLIPVDINPITEGKTGTLATYLPGVESYLEEKRVADFEMLEYVPDITDAPKAVALIQELVDKFPDIEVRGSLEKCQAAFLAAEIDELSYDYDPYQYKDTVEDREAQVANIAEDIRSRQYGISERFPE